MAKKKGKMGDTKQSMYGRKGINGAYKGIKK